MTDPQNLIGVSFDPYNEWGYVALVWKGEHINLASEAAALLGVQLLAAARHTDKRKRTDDSVDAFINSLMDLRE